MLRILADDVIPLQAVVEDNVKLERVEFYHNGTYIGVDDEWPYGFDWAITGEGEERFSAVAFDAAGNQSNADVVAEVLRGGT